MHEMAGAVIDRLEIDANGLTFTARAAGPPQGRGVILLHGFPQTSWSWRTQLGALADAGYHAAAPDQRGYSAGAPPPCGGRAPGGDLTTVASAPISSARMGR
jgi:pimeloyl-ACP methyl ester carboxylesterase